jgi:hypothetical protein
MGRVARARARTVENNFTREGVVEARDDVG